MLGYFEKSTNFTLKTKTFKGVLGIHLTLYSIWDLLNGLELLGKIKKVTLDSIYPNLIFDFRRNVASVSLFNIIDAQFNLIFISH